MPEHIHGDDLAWRVASSCGGGGCVAVATAADGTVAVKDTKDPQSPVLRYTPSEWSTFVSAVKDGEFDVAPAR